MTMTMCSILPTGEFPGASAGGPVTPAGTSGTGQTALAGTVLTGAGVGVPVDPTGVLVGALVGADDELRVGDVDGALEALTGPGPTDVPAWHPAVTSAMANIKSESDLGDV